MDEAVKWAEFAVLAEGHRRAGMMDQAEQMARSGLDDQPDCAEGALVMALVLLDQNRGEEARVVLESWTDTNLGVEVTDDSISGEVFDADVSDGELEVAFESAETDRDQVVDADAIAQRAMMQAEVDSADEFASPDSSFATRTVADLLAQQGDEQRASQLRAMMDSSRSDHAKAIEGRNARKIERLERWLANVRGGMR